MSNLYFPICGFMISILNFIVFFNKERINNEDTKSFKIMLISSLLDSILLLIIIFKGIINKYDLLEIKILNKIDFIMYLFWIKEFFLYNLYLLKSFNKITIKKLFFIKKIARIFNIISIIVILLAPIYPYNKNGIMYVSGTGTSVLYIVFALYLILITFFALFNYKNIIKKKYIPLYILIVIIFLSMLIRNYDPTILITSFIVSFINLIMYFTIENPDLKLLTIAEENRKIALKSFEEKSNLLFQISQEVKNPINSIKKYSDNILNSKTKKEDIYNANKINLECTNINTIVNNVLDLSSMDINKMKAINNKYNVYNFFKELELKSKELNNINYNFNISSLLPKYLYGDSLKLKQILSKVLEFYNNNMKKGNINIEVNNIDKYDVCRLVISINTNAFWLDVNTINNIFNNDINIDEEIYTNFEKEQPNMQLINKLINMLGGSMIIRSDKIYCETVIIIDQKIDKEFNKTMDLYNDNKIILVDDKISSINRFKKYLKEQNVTISMYGLDLINRIRHGEIYKLILLDDEMEPMNGFEVINQLKNIDNFNIPVIILLNRSKEIIKNKYKDIGFKDYIFKDDLDNEIKKINKYL